MPTASERQLFDRDRLEGRIAFVVAAFVVAYAFIALLDRVGAPQGFVAALSPFFTLAALALLGFLLHSMRVSLYYVAGRATPASYAGFGAAATALALTLPFATQLVGASWLSGPGAGLFVGVAAAGLWLGPLLRRTGAFSLAGLLSARFPSPPARLGVIAVDATAGALVALAGHQIAVEALAAHSGADRPVLAALTGAAILFVAAPGGLFGVVWTSAAAAGVALAGLGCSAAMLAAQGGSFAHPIGGDASVADAAALMRAWGALAPTSVGFSAFGGAAATALGLATLAPLLAPSLTTYNSASARRAGASALFWSFILTSLTALVIAASALALARGVGGRAVDRLPEAVYVASARGAATICGQAAAGPAEARKACAAAGVAPGAPLRPEQVAAKPELLLLGLPDLEGFGAAFAGLLAAAVIALGVALGAGGMQACATALGHEAFYHWRGDADLTSRRLAATRVALVAVAALGVASTSAGLFDAKALARLALSLSAATLGPVAALAFWPRAGARDALIALVAGLAAMAGLGAAGPGLAPLDAFALSTLGGAVFGLGAGVASALTRPAATSDAAFVRRMIYGDGQVMKPDRGA
jgi:cation/acetate symporter